MKAKKEVTQRKGFTILEILVVLSVIAILIGIAVPRFKGMQDEANITKAKSEMKVYQSAIESYKNNTGAYPATSAAVGTTLAAASPNITAALTDPFTASDDYDYVLSGNGLYYVVASVGVSTDGAISAISAQGTVTETGSPLCVTNGSGC